MNFVEGIHSSMCDYYLGVWGGGHPKPFSYTQEQMKKFDKKDNRGEADRKVPSQPLFFKDEQGEKIVR